MDIRPLVPRPTCSGPSVTAPSCDSANWLLREALYGFPKLERSLILLEQRVLDFGIGIGPELPSYYLHMLMKHHPSGISALGKAVNYLIATDLVAKGKKACVACDRRQANLRLRHSFPFWSIC